MTESTAVQPSPITFTPSAAALASSGVTSARGAASALRSVTLAPLGTVNSKVFADGAANDTSVKWTSSTVLPSVPLTTTDSGTPLSAATAIRTSPIVEPDPVGFTLSR